MRVFAYSKVDVLRNMLETSRGVLRAQRPVHEELNEMTNEQYEAARKVVATRYIPSSRKRIKVTIPRSPEAKRKA